MIWLVLAMSGVEPGSVEISKREKRARTHPGRDGSDDDWLCKWCLNCVAREKDRFSHGGASEFSFKNLLGVLFRLITFSRTIGCRRVGVPTLEHTWFPGHAWSYCMCDCCHGHLGWFYAGSSEFAGLIRDRIVPASAVMN